MARGSRSDQDEVMNRRGGKWAGYKKQQKTAGRSHPPYHANQRATHERKRTMPDETTFELASVHFGAEPVAVFRSAMNGSSCVPGLVLET